MGQVIKRALSQTHVTWFSNRGGLGKGCDLSNLPNLQNIVCLQKVANPQMQSCLSLSDLLPRFPATAHSYLSQPFCVLWSAVILSRFPEIQVKMEKPYFGYHLICYLWSFTSEGPFTGNGCEKISNSCSFVLVGNLAKTTHWIPINGCQQSEPDAGGCWSTLFSQGRGVGCGGSWCENRASSSYQLFYSRPASARLTL